MFCKWLLQQKKPQLIEVVNHYKLEVNGTKKKGEIKRLLIDHLIDEETILEDEVNATSIHTTDENTLELWCLELQDREKEQESQLKLKELEIRKKELSVQLWLKESEMPTSATSKSPSEY